MAKSTSSTPDSVDSLIELISTAGEQEEALNIQGRGSKKIFGAPVKNTQTLTMTKFDRVLDYQPSEMILTAQAGVKVRDVLSLIDAENQMLAFEPLDYGRIYQQRSDHGTIGGMVAAGMAGSRRMTHGNVRDHVLGFEAVSGRGERFIAGGKVVKNVTGFDLSKLVTGSWGRLAALVSVTLKTVPKPELSETICLWGLLPQDGHRAMTAVMKLPIGISGASYVPATECGRQSCTTFRIEGFKPTINTGVRNLSRVLFDFGKLESLSRKAAHTHWQDVQTAKIFSDDAPLWQIHSPPSGGLKIVRQLEAQGAPWLWDRAGGITWTAYDGEPASLRQWADEAGGYAILMRASEAVRGEVPTLHPLQPAMANLEDRVSASFDPLGVFKTGRFDRTLP